MKTGDMGHGVLTLHTKQSHLQNMRVQTVHEPSLTMHNSLLLQTGISEVLCHTVVEKAFFVIPVGRDHFVTCCSGDFRGIAEFLKTLDPISTCWPILFNFLRAYFPPCGDCRRTSHRPHGAVRCAKKGKATCNPTNRERAQRSSFETASHSWRLPPSIHTPLLQL